MPSWQRRPASCVLFDVDGTLVDTKDAVVKAYAEAGVEVPPDFWGKTWQAWLPQMVGNARAVEVHNAKNDIYMQMLKHVQRTGAADAAWLIHTAELSEIGFLTGASEEPSKQILWDLGFGVEEHIYGYSMSVNDKAQMIKMAQRFYPGGVTYVDDSQTAGEDIASITGCRFVHYAGQTRDELMELIWTP